MAEIDSEKLLNALIAAAQAQEPVRDLTEKFIKYRIQQKSDLDPGELEALVEKIYRHMFGAVGEFKTEKAKEAKSAFSWFMTCVDHAVIDCARRKKGPHPQSLLGPEGEEPPDNTHLSPEAAHEHVSALEDLCTAFSRLTADWERVILLLPEFLGDIDYPKITQIMGLPSIGDARVRMFRAREHMRTILAELGWDPARIEATFR